MAIDGDFNGIVDLAGGKSTASMTACSVPNAAVTLALNNGSGQFVNAYTAASSAAYPARLNADNTVDFISFAWQLAGRCSIGFFDGCTVHKSGPGGYTTSDCPAGALVGGSVKIADLNADGIDDVIGLASGAMVVLMNNGAGSFTSVPLADSTAEFPESFAVYDWNSDG